MQHRLEKMQSDLGVVLGFIKYSTDRDKLEDYIHRHKEFRAMANESVWLLNEVCSLQLKDINEIQSGQEGKGETDLCKAFEDMKEEGRLEGRLEGELRKLISLICRKLIKGKDARTIADELEEEPSQVEKICEIAQRFAPDYDENRIFEQMKMG
ncbi:MAG: hypothetical protein ACI4EK_05690 [Wujia sp.]